MADSNRISGSPKRNRSVIAFETAFLELLREKPYSRISISDIIKRSDYSRTAFYSNYVDKEDFVLKMIRDEVKCHVQAIYGTISDKTPHLFNGNIYLPALKLFSHVYERRDFYHMLFAGSIDGWDTQSFADECCALFRKSLMVYSPNYPDINSEMYHYVETLRFINFIMFWDANDYCYTAEYMASQVGMQIKVQSCDVLESIEVLPLVYDRN